MSNNSNGHYKESDCYDRKVIDELQEQSKIEIDTAYEKHRLDYKLVRLLVELKFDLDMHWKMIVNGILYRYDFHRDWKYFIEKQKKWGMLHVVLIYPKTL